MAVPFEPITQTLAVVPVACIHRDRSGHIGIGVEKRPETIALLDRIALLQVGKSKSSGDSRKVVNCLVTLKQFSLVIGHAYLIEIWVSRCVIANLMSVDTPLPN